MEDGWKPAVALGVLWLLTIGCLAVMWQYSQWAPGVNWWALGILGWLLPIVIIYVPTFVALGFDGFPAIASDDGLYLFLVIVPSWPIILVLVPFIWIFEF